MTSASDSQLTGAARDLVTLPEGVLSSEAEILQALSDVEASAAPLNEKLRQIEAADLSPFLTGSRLRGPLRLLIDILPGLSELQISSINPDWPPAVLNEELPLTTVQSQPLMQVPNPRLIFSAHALNRWGSDSARELAAQLFAYGRRITRFHGVSVSWDQSVDRGVWTTNIDTANFIQRLVDAGVPQNPRIGTAMEVGVGGGAITKTLLMRCPALREHTATDISPYALMCTKRNVAPVLRPGQRLNLYLGKGIRSIRVKVDLLVVNPPYIPTLKPPDQTDPYRGTGLIKEIIACGRQYLNPNNPEAAVYLGMSSLAQQDLERYLEQHPHWEVERLGPELEVPLKIFHVNENRSWLELLEREYGLLRCGRRLAADGFELWHRISVLRLRSKSK